MGILQVTFKSPEEAKSKLDLQPEATQYPVVTGEIGTGSHLDVLSTFNIWKVSK